MTAWIIRYVWPLVGDTLMLSATIGVFVFAIRHGGGCIRTPSNPGDDHNA